MKMLSCLKRGFEKAIKCLKFIYYKLIFIISPLSFFVVILSTIGYWYSGLNLEKKILYKNDYEPLFKIVKWFIKDNDQLILFALFGIGIGNLIFFLEKFVANRTISRLKTRLATKENENEEMTRSKRSLEVDCEKLFMSLLHGAYLALELQENYRISLYRLSNDNFICLSRFSTNQRLKNKPNRLYNKIHGCIGLAWEKGFYVIEGLSNPLTNPGKYYTELEKRCNLPQHIAEPIRTKSRSVLGSAIVDPANGESIGVVIIETLNRNISSKSKPDRVSEIRKYFENGENIKILNLMKELKNHLPELESAASRGL